MDNERLTPANDLLTRNIIGAALDVHRFLGPGLLESTYEACLAHELRLRGHVIAQQVEVPLRYKGLDVEVGYRMDLVVDGTVVVEIKAVEKLRPIVTAQVLTYLRLSGLRGALICNFHVGLLKEGIRRVSR
jgi:GxxExxY protein